MIGEDVIFLELFGVESIRATRLLTSRKEIIEIYFNVGDKVLLAHEEAVVLPKKWQELDSKLYGPCEVVSVKNQLYGLRSYHGHIFRRGIHNRPLVCNSERLVNLRNVLCIINFGFL